MGGFYSSQFKCTKCDYLEVIRNAPASLNPIDNNPQAKLDTRWCHNCKGVRSIFTGLGYKYTPSSYDNPDKQYWMNSDSSIDQLNKEKDDHKSKLDSLIIEKKNIKLTIIQKIFGNHIKKLNNKIEENKKNISSLNIKIEEYLKATKSAIALTQKAKVFYENQTKNIVPKCLCCGSKEVSSFHFSDETHASCGGKIIEIDLGRGGSTSIYLNLNYDEYGNSSATMNYFDGGVYEDLEKPYLI
jgi:hypothetical protein